MEALVWLGGDQLEVQDVPEPENQPGKIVVDVTVAAVCGSDLHAYRGHGGKRRPPLVLGHEAVVSLPGSDRHFAVLPLTSCGACPSCRSGRENLCPERVLLGLDVPGTFAAKVAVSEEALFEMPGALTPELAVLVEPLATAVQALGDVPSGSEVVVLGCGTIGLLTAFAAASQGAVVTAVDPLAARRTAAGDLGASVLLASVDELAASFAARCVDAVGIESTWRAGLRVLRPGGSITVVGLGQADGTIPIGDIVRGGLTVTGSYAYTRRDFEAARDLLAAGGLGTGWLTSMPLAEGRRAFASLVEQPDRFLKVLLRPAG